MADQTDEVRKPAVGDSAPNDRSDAKESERRRPLPRIEPGWTIKGL